MEHNQVTNCHKVFGMSKTHQQYVFPLVRMEGLIIKTSRIRLHFNAKYLIFFIEQTFFFKIGQTEMQRDSLDN